MATMVETRPIGINEQDIRQYEEDGAICLRGVIDAEWIERLREATERMLAADLMDLSQSGGTGKFVGDLNVWSKNPDFRAFALQGPSSQIAKALMRSSQVRLFADQLFIKEPGTSTPTPWHHDQTYWPVTGEHICSVWVTMDTVTRESSGLEYVRGSHRWNRRFNPADFGERSMEKLHEAGNETMPDIDAKRKEHEFLSWDMEPGDCLVHHSLAVHGAGGNRSSSIWRRAISTRWFGDLAYFKPIAPFTPEIVGIEPGAPMTSPMFPVVPVAEDTEFVAWPPTR